MPDLVGQYTQLPHGVCEKPTPGDVYGGYALWMAGRPVSGGMTQFLAWRAAQVGPRGGGSWS